MASPFIRSAENPRFKEWRSLLESRGIRRHGKAIVGGAKLIPELASEFEGRVNCWLVPESMEPPGYKGAVFTLARPLFRELDMHGTGGPLAVVAVPPSEDPGLVPDTPGCTVYLPFQDPANVGAAVRSAVAFGVEDIVLLEEASHPFHPKSVRAGGTALFRVRWYHGPSISRLTGGDPPLIALAMAGEPLPGFRFPLRFGLVPGLEGPGLPRGFKADISLAIPMRAGVESLNAAVAVSIALYEWRRSSVSEIV